MSNYTFHGSSEFGYAVPLVEQNASYVIAKRDGRALRQD
jgi:hypothetical protein